MRNVGVLILVHHNILKFFLIFTQNLGVRHQNSKRIQQYIAKINKGLSKTEDRAVNEYMPDDQRVIPYKRMIYLGDGMTDIPSMKIIKEKGGNAIAVYRPKSKHRKTAIKLLMDNRVNFALPADYREDSELDNVVKTILDKMATERDLDILKAKEDKKKMIQKK